MCKLGMEQRCQIELISVVNISIVKFDLAI